jgi:hypothetical protein
MGSNQFSPIVKEKRYFAPNEDVQGGDPAGDQSFREGGVALKRKVPGEIAPRVESFRRFPDEFEMWNREGHDFKVMPEKAREKLSASGVRDGLAGGEDYGYFAS